MNDNSGLPTGSTINLSSQWQLAWPRGPGGVGCWAGGWPSSGIAP